MKLTYSIKFWVTREQYEKIKKCVQEKGDISISSYVRGIVMDSISKNKLSEIYYIVKEIKNEKSKLGTNKETK